MFDWITWEKIFRFSFILSFLENLDCSEFLWLRLNSYLYTQIRDTSVLVRLRPSWEELRSYLTAKGRKRFEVYVCTMAERDYALEMWRLLDPEGNLINSNDLLARIVCVKPGTLFINLYLLIIHHGIISNKLLINHNRFKKITVQCVSRWNLPSKDGTGN